MDKTRMGQRPRGASMRRWAALLVGGVAVACTPDAPADSGEPPRPGVARADDGASTRRRCRYPRGAFLGQARVPDGYCPWVYADGLVAPRGLVVDGARVLVLERGQARVVALEDRNRDGVIGPGERRTLVQRDGLNHGLAVHRGHLYASSPTTVWRWPYRAGRVGSPGRPAVVLSGMPGSGHATRTLIARGRHLYVSVGSAGNVDRDSRRSRVVRVPVHPLPDGGFRWGGDEVELWADGLRNEVGLAFDARGRLWGVQNGIDNLHRDDLGGDIHDDNPAEELNLLDRRGAFHGYPFCWTEFRIPGTRGGRGPGTQWAHPRTRRRRGDGWCRSAAVTPPRLAMQAHAAPLGLTFYQGTAFPEVVRGDAFVAFHGSWNRPVPTGYKVARVHFRDSDTPTRVEPFLAYRGRGDRSPSWPHRPVDLAVTVDGVLLVTSDRSGVVLAIDHDGGPR